MSVLPVGPIDAKLKNLFCFIQCNEHHTLSSFIGYV